MEVLVLIRFTALRLVAQWVFLVKAPFNSLTLSIKVPTQGPDCLFVAKVIWSACWSFQRSFALTSLIISRLMLLIYAIMFRSLPLGIPVQVVERFADVRQFHVFQPLKNNQQISGSNFVRVINSRF